MALFSCSACIIPTELYLYIYSSNPQLIPFSLIFNTSNCFLQLYFVLMYFLFVKVLTVLIHSSYRFSEQLYDHDLGLFIRQIVCLLLIFFFFLRFYLSLPLEHIPVFSHFSWLCLFLCSRWNRHLSQSWRSGLVSEMNLIHPCPSSWLSLETLRLSK